MWARTVRGARGEVEPRRPDLSRQWWPSLRWPPIHTSGLLPLPNKRRQSTCRRARALFFFQTRKKARDPFLICAATTRWQAAAHELQGRDCHCGQAKAWKGRSRDACNTYEPQPKCPGNTRAHTVNRQRARPLMNDVSSNGNAISKWAGRMRRAPITTRILRGPHYSCSTSRE